MADQEFENEWGGTNITVGLAERRSKWKLWPYVAFVTEVHALSACVLHLDKKSKGLHQRNNPPHILNGNISLWRGDNFLFSVSATLVL